MLKKIKFLKTTTPIVMGNIAEWYDFAIYGYLSPVLGKLFFPAHSVFITMLATFAVFSVGYLARPIGAAISGYFGDKFGRKVCMFYTILTMGFCSLFISLLPTYQSIGLAAGILLTILRFIQGIAMGGEYSGAVVYLIENSSSKYRGFNGSLALFCCYSGFLLSSGVGALVGWMYHGVYEFGAWRIPFLVGAFISFLGFYLRIKIQETSTFMHLSHTKQLVKNPLKEVVIVNRLKIIKTIGITLLPAVASYLFVYLTTFINVFRKVPLEKALWMNTIAIVFMLVTIPAIGFLSDKVGRKPILIFGSAVFFFAAYPFFYFFAHGSTEYFLIGEILFACLVAICESITPTTVAESFPSNLRYTGVALTLNIANGFFGGTAPLVATLMIQLTGNLTAPAFYICVVAVISFISSSLLSKYFNL